MKKFKEFYEKYRVKIGMIIILSILLLMLLKFGEQTEAKKTPVISTETGCSMEYMN